VPRPVCSEEVSGVYRLAAWHRPCPEHGTPTWRPSDAVVALSPAWHPHRPTAGRCTRSGSFSRPTTMPSVPPESSTWPWFPQPFSPAPARAGWLGLSLGQSMAAAYEALCSSPARLIGRYGAGPCHPGLTALADSLVTAALDLPAIACGVRRNRSRATHRAPAGRTQPPAGPGPVSAGSCPTPGSRLCGQPLGCRRRRRRGCAQAAGGGTVEAVANVQPASRSFGKNSPCPSLLLPPLPSASAAVPLASPRTQPLGDSPGHMLSQESSFTQLVRLWMELHELPALHGLYCAPLWWLHVWATRRRTWRADPLCRAPDPPARRPELATPPVGQRRMAPDPLAPTRPLLVGSQRNGPSGRCGRPERPQAMLETLHSDLLRPYRPPPPQ
jgi:hypothetical protein